MTQLPEGKITPKEALRLIQQVIPGVNRIHRLEFVGQPNTFGVGPQANIEWGDTTEYTEPKYRPPTLDDILERKKVEVMVDSDYWVEGTLIGVAYYSDEPSWIVVTKSCLQTKLRCRVPVTYLPMS